MVIPMVKQFSDSISFFRFFLFFFFDILEPREDKSIEKIGKILRWNDIFEEDGLFNLIQ